MMLAWIAHQLGMGVGTSVIDTAALVSLEDLAVVAPWLQDCDLTIPRLLSVAVIVPRLDSLEVLP